MNGCRNCKYFKCYPGDYWTPDDFECQMPDKDYGLTDEEADEILTRVWENSEEWNCTDDPICPAWELYVEPLYPEDIPDEVWQKER